ncbi:gas vesicle protein GvpO [Kutzneria sp. NPDC051319]|uniref:gas vesicle protein GvpO n=1 Tax=Kutzneria sp. NPDC051319 TaxID=3155047 RepID=UPI00344913BF
MSEQQPPNTAAAAMESARSQFHTMTGHDNCTATGIKARPEGGWSVLFDVVELARIPASTSVVATYRVDVDADGGLCGFERLRRYTRGATDG